MRATKQDRLVAKTPEAQVVLADLAELARSYVAGGMPMWTPMSRSLPQGIDAEIANPKIFRQMMRDPWIRSSINRIRMGCMENDCQFVPAIDPPTKSKATQADLARYNRSKDIADEALRAHQDMDRPIEDVLYEMYGMLIYGHRAAEQVMRTETMGVDAGKLVIDAIETKPRDNYAFVVDMANKVMGLVAAMPGISLSIPTGYGMAFESLPNFMPPEKWLWVTNGGEDGSPLGESALEGAVVPHKAKMRMYPELIRFIVQFGGPALVGYTPEEKPGAGGSGPLTQRKSGTQDAGLTPEDVMFRALELFQAGSIVVLRGGSKLDLIQSQGEGRAHMAAIDMVNREMVQGILLQIRATMEAAKGGLGNGDSDTGENTLNVVVSHYQGIVERAYRRQVLRRWTSYNYGVDVAREFTPRLSLREVARPDFEAEGNTVAALQQSGYLHPSQYPELDERLGLPERDMNAVMEELQQQQDNQQMTAKSKARLMDTGDGPEKEQEHAA